MRSSFAVRVLLALALVVAPGLHAFVVCPSPDVVSHVADARAHHHGGHSHGDHNDAAPSDHHDTGTQHTADQACCDTACNMACTAVLPAFVSAAPLLLPVTAFPAMRVAAHGLSLTPALHPPKPTRFAVAA